MPESIDKCPISPECTAKKLYRDDEGKLFRLDAKNAEFIPHVCHTKGSELPKISYVGEWYNTETKLTRWIGPNRLRRSCEIPPADGKYRKRGNNPAWVLNGIWVTDNTWKRVDE